MQQEGKSWSAQTCFTGFSFTYLQVKLNFIVCLYSKYVIQIPANVGRWPNPRYESSLWVYYNNTKNDIKKKIPEIILPDTFSQYNFLKSSNTSITVTFWSDKSTVVNKTVHRLQDWKK